MDQVFQQLIRLYQADIPEATMRQYNTVLLYLKRADQVPDLSRECYKFIWEAIDVIVQGRDDEIYCPTCATYCTYDYSVECWLTEQLIIRRRPTPMIQKLVPESGHMVVAKLYPFPNPPKSEPSN